MQSKGKNRMLNFAIVFLSFMLVVLFLYTTSGFYQAGSAYTYTEDNLLRNIESGRYENLIGNVYENEAHGVEITDTMAECYAVAHYFEAASFYKAYLQNGRIESAEEKEKIMEEQKLLMGDLEFVAEDINERLGLED